MIVGVDRPANRVDDGQVMRLLCQQRQMLAQPHTWRRGADGSKRSAILCRGVRLHIPGVEVRSTATEKEEDHRLGLAASANGGVGGVQLRLAKSESGHACSGGDEEVAATVAGLSGKAAGCVRWWHVPSSPPVAKAYAA